MASAALAIEGLTMRYGRAGRVALDELTLTVDPGTIFAFVGPNGAGKTTTLKCVLGLVFPTTGAIRVLGGAIGDPKVRARLGYLPEEPVLHAFLTVEDVLCFYGALFGYSGARLRERVQATLDLVAMSDRRAQKMQELSKGLRQRVLLGQALINDPELILLDEPQSGLDPVGIQDLRQLLARLKAAGKTVFLNSHQLTEVEQVADRIGILREGRLVREAAVAELLHTGSTWRVRLAGLTRAQADALVGEYLERLPLAEAAALGSNPVVIELELNSDLTFRCREEAAAQYFMARAQEQGGRLAGFSEESTSLETLFLDLVGAAEPAHG